MFLRFMFLALTSALTSRRPCPAAWGPGGHHRLCVFPGIPTGSAFPNSPESGHCSPLRSCHRDTHHHCLLLGCVQSPPPCSVLPLPPDRWFCAHTLCQSHSLLLSSEPSRGPHLTRYKSPGPEDGLDRPSVSCLSIPTFISLTLSPNVPSMFQPQGLCTCCLLGLEHSIGIHVVTSLGLCSDISVDQCSLP